MRSTSHPAQLKRALFKHCDEVSRILKSLAHPIRLKVLCTLLEGEKSVNTLTETCEIPQAAMSQFLKRMKNEKILKSRREGTFNYYQIADEKLVKLLSSIKDVYCS